MSTRRSKEERRLKRKYTQSGLNTIKQIVSDDDFDFEDKENFCYKTSLLENTQGDLVTRHQYTTDKINKEKESSSSEQKELKRSEIIYNLRYKGSQREESRQMERGMSISKQKNKFKNENQLNRQNSQGARRNFTEINERIDSLIKKSKKTFLKLKKNRIVFQNITSKTEKNLKKKNREDYIKRLFNPNYRSQTPENRSIPTIEPKTKCIRVFSESLSLKKLIRNISPSTEIEFLSTYRRNNIKSLPSSRYQSIQQIESIHNARSSQRNVSNTFTFGNSISPNSLTAKFESGSRVQFNNPSSLPTPFVLEFNKREGQNQMMRNLNINIKDEDSVKILKSNRSQSKIDEKSSDYSDFQSSIRSPTCDQKSYLYSTKGFKNHSSGFYNKIVINKTNREDQLLTDYRLDSDDSKKWAEQLSITESHKKIYDEIESVRYGHKFRLNSRSMKSIASPSLDSESFISEKNQEETFPNIMKHFNNDKAESGEESVYGMPGIAFDSNSSNGTVETSKKLSGIVTAVFSPRGQTQPNSELDLIEEVKEEHEITSSQIKYQYLYNNLNIGDSIGGPESKKMKMKKNMKFSTISGDFGNKKSTFEFENEGNQQSTNSMKKESISGETDPTKKTANKIRYVKSEEVLSLNNSMTKVKHDEYSDSDNKLQKDTKDLVILPQNSESSRYVRSNEVDEFIEVLNTTMVIS